MVVELAEDELKNFAKVWALAFLSLSYCYAIGKLTSKGFTRLIAILPVNIMFLTLPLKLTSLHFCGFTSFFITWLANFKLLLFAFGKPPLCSNSNPPISFPRFLALACLPIKIQNSSNSDHKSHPHTKMLKKSKIDQYPNHKTQNKSHPHTKMLEKKSKIDQYPNHKTQYKSHPHTKMLEISKIDQYPHHKTQNKSHPHTKMLEKSKIDQYPHHKTPKKLDPSCQKSPWGYNLIIKGSIIPLILKLYQYSNQIPQKALWVIYFFHIYLTLEIILALLANSTKYFLGLELEPQFNEPLLSSSLQDFWGKRWNLMVSGILKPTIFHPLRNFSCRVLGPDPARLVAVMGTFIVSALMHELIFFYLARVKPTYEITCFFLIHGFCLCVEICLKKYLAGKRGVQRWITGVATKIVVVGSAFWLFMPPLLRAGLATKGPQEYALIGAFVRRVIGGIF